MTAIFVFFIYSINAILMGMETLLKEKTQVAVAPRRIALRTFGHRHGPITRLVSPSEIGEAIKPFVFLDRGEVRYSGRPLFGIHPHSGIATLTVVLDGQMAYEDTTGKKGEIAAASGTTAARCRARRCACSSSGSRSAPTRSSRRRRAITSRGKECSRKVRCAWYLANTAVHAA